MTRYSLTRVRGGQAVTLAKSHRASGSYPVLLLPEPCRAKDANPRDAGEEQAAQGSEKRAARPVLRRSGSYPCCKVSTANRGNVPRG